MICTRNAVLFLVLMSSAFISIPHASGCGGGCVVSGGGGGGGEASYNFMGDRAVDMDMSSFDEFARDNLGNHQTTLRAIPLSHEIMRKANSSINLTCNRNMSQNCSAVCSVSNGPGNTMSDNKTVKLGAAGIQDNRVSSMVFAAFNNNML